MTRLDLVVGPNGSGKSTFVELVLAGQRGATPFVNADVLAAQRWPDDPAGHGHDAAHEAAAIRDAMIGRGQPFIAETVASHPSKVDLVWRARAAGYHVHLVVVLVPVDLAVARVAQRVANGGHVVPEDRIRGRYERLWPNVADMLEIVSSADVYDNAGPGPVRAATFVAGELIGRARWPSWTPEVLRARW